MYSISTFGKGILSKGNLINVITRKHIKLLKYPLKEPSISVVVAVTPMIIITVLKCPYTVMINTKYTIWEWLINMTRVLGKE